MARDMSRKQFREALARRGFRQSLLWIEIGNGTSIGMVLSRKGARGWKTDYRASLAKAIREADRANAGAELQCHA